MQKLKKNKVINPTTSKYNYIYLFPLSSTKGIFFLAIWYFIDVSYSLKIEQAKVIVVIGVAALVA